MVLDPTGINGLEGEAGARYGWMDGCIYVLDGMDGFAFISSIFDQMDESIQSCSSPLGL